MSALSEYFLNSARSIVKLELLEISHPSFTQTYRFVRNAVDGVTVTLETSLPASFSYMPMKIRQLGMSDDLDFGVEITIGDVNGLVTAELDNAMDADTMDVRPVAKYREYRSDVLTAPLAGPYTLEIKKGTVTAEGFAFHAKAPQFNVAKTGELYRINRFTPLRGTL